MTMAAPPKKVRRRINWKRFGIFLTCCVLFVALTVGSCLYTIWLSLVGGSFPGGTAKGEGVLPLEVGEGINILLLGLDAGIIEGSTARAPSRTDTMMVLSFDPETMEGGVISIPRDTRVNIPGKGTNKINAAHVFGGPQLAMKTTEALLGIPLHYYVKVNLEGFEKIVDSLGGIEIEVEKDMNYWDPTQDLLIDLKAGKQTLSGSQALDYVRWREDGKGDVGRIPRQQKFLRILADKLLSMSTVWKLPELVGIFTKNVETDMDVLLVLQYAEKMRKMDLEKLEIETLSGIDRYVNDVSYWLVDEEGMQEQVDRILRRIKPEENRDIRVQVLNGNGRSGDASELAAELRRYGFNVVAVGNADHFDYKENLLIPHSEESSVVRQVARVVGIYCVGQDEDFAENRDERADVTIIVGKNYK